MGMTADKLRQMGWQESREPGFASTVGAFWTLDDADEQRYGLLVDARHLNHNGTLHGGALLALADQALGQTSAAATGVLKQATIHLGLDFVAPAFENEFVVAETSLTRRTRSVMFVSAILTVEGRIIATASGLWKTLGQ